MDSSFHEPELTQQLHDRKVQLAWLQKHPEGIYNFGSTEQINTEGTRLKSEITELESRIIPESSLATNALQRVLNETIIH